MTIERGLSLFIQDSSLRMTDGVGITLSSIQSSGNKVISPRHR